MEARKWRRIPFGEIREIRWCAGLKGHVLQITHGPKARSTQISSISVNGKQLRWPTSHDRDWPEQSLFNALRDRTRLEVATSSTAVTEGQAAQRLRLWAVYLTVPMIGMIPLVFDIDTAWTLPLVTLITAPAQISAKVLGPDFVFCNGFRKQIVPLDDICTLRFAPLFGRWEKLRVLHFSTRSRLKPVVVLALSQERPRAQTGPILSEILDKTGLPVE